MKQFWLAFGLLLSMLTATLGNAFYLRELAQTVTEQLEAAEAMAQRGAWEQADIITRQCFSHWTDQHTYLHIIARHSDTDEILISFRAVMQYLSLEEMDQYAAENRDLITRIELLAEMEQPDLLNIL